MNKAALIAILLVLVIVVGSLVYYNIKPPLPNAELAALPGSIASGRYPEFLRESLNLEIKIVDKTAWISLTNKSNKETIPNEETHRSIVCATELLDAGNQPLGVYKEYFKRQPPEMGIPSMQIAPGATTKFGYDLTTPHGIVRIRITYEDFSAVGTNQPDDGKILITEQEVKF